MAVGVITLCKLLYNPDSVISMRQRTADVNKDTVSDGGEASCSAAKMRSSQFSHSSVSSVMSEGGRSGRTVTLRLKYYMC